ncbi:MAG: FAD-dependent oxidoreductase, partial [Planctomycetota bacterium]|nr:FAD-dependent oxidoreductase [Planctomycetota bacterium]
MTGAVTNDASHAPCRIAVVGGGITGLAAAFRLMERARESNRSIDLHLYEAGDRLGGLITTREIDGYQVELGPDSFITNKPAAAGLCHRLGLDDQLIGTDERYRRSLVLRKGRPVEVPD